MKSILSSAAKWLKAMAGHNYRSKKLMLFVMTLLLVKKWKTCWREPEEIHGTFHTYPGM
jgi:hypothetical protein